MCGIIGYVGAQPAQHFLLDGLRSLEHRGYDSAGIGLLTRGKLKTWKVAGKLSALHAALPSKPVSASTGIGHTRWATHGDVQDANAHPHTDATNQVAVVHNGIVENADQLRNTLLERGVEFSSSTDSEVIAHLIAADAASTLTQRVSNTLKLLRGTYGIAAIDCNEPGVIVAACNGSPLHIGLTDGATLIASDVIALNRHAKKISPLNDGDIATVTASGVQVIASDNFKLPQQDADSSGQPEPPTDSGSLMAYELTRQAQSINRTLGGRLDHQFGTAHLGGLNLDTQTLLNFSNIKILGCGSAFNAGSAGALMIESLARIPADAEPSAQFRHRNPVINRNALYIIVSQSGETSDSLAVLREIQRKGGRAVGIVNAVGSSIAREVDGGIYMHAGPEHSVTATKTYTCTLVCFALLALYLGRLRDLSPQQGLGLVSALDKLPQLVQEVLDQQPTIAEIAETYTRTKSLFLTSGAMSYPIALEGAQKLREIAYIHADPCPLSELQHGTLTLLTKHTPVVALVLEDALLDYTLDVLTSIKNSKAPIIAITDSSDPRLTELSTHRLQIPRVDTLLQPILLAIALQLFAYHCALPLGRNIDQPRGLTKSISAN